MTFPASIPIELMELLNKINENISEVKTRITRIEAMDHSYSIQSLRSDIEKERNERIKLQIELENLRTKLAPVVIGISMLAASAIGFVFRNLF